MTQSYILLNNMVGQFIVSGGYNGYRCGDYTTAARNQ